MNSSRISLIKLGRKRKLARWVKVHPPDSIVVIDSGSENKPSQGLQLIQAL